MPQFPKEEPNIIQLAHKIAGGMNADQKRFAAPPIAPDALAADLVAYEDKINQIVAARAAAIHATEEKNQLLDKIIAAAKDNIAYAEIVAQGDDAVLKEIGWAGRSAPTKLQKPAQTTYLEILEQGDGWVRLDWKEPRGGGKPASYIVERSEDGGQNWTEAKTSIESEAALFNQPRAKKLLYQVVAINRAGTGEPSNIVALTL